MNERRLLRLVAGVLAALWLALPVAAAVHGVVEAHEYCARHQAVEHGGPHHEHLAGDTRLCDENSEGGDHEVCELGDALVRNAVELDGPAVRDAAPVVGVDAFDLVVDAVVEIAILDLAPKTSPPTLFV